MRRGARGGEARTVMSLPTFSRLGIVSEARLALFITCRGDERGAGLDSGAVCQGRCGEGEAVRRGGRGGEART